MSRTLAQEARARAREARRRGEVPLSWWEWLIVVVMILTVGWLAGHRAGLP